MFSKLFFERLTDDKKLNILRNFFHEPNLTKRDFSSIQQIKILNTSVFITFVKSEFKDEFTLINFSGHTSPEFKTRLK